MGVYGSIIALFTRPGGLRLTLIFVSWKPFALEIASPRRRSARLADTPRSPRDLQPPQHRAPKPFTAASINFPTPFNFSNLDRKKQVVSDGV